MRSFLHRVDVYVGIREDAPLQQRWNAAEPDKAVLIAVWAIPTVVLVAVVVGALAAAIWVVATNAVLLKVAVVLTLLIVAGWVRLKIGAAHGRSDSR